MGLGLQLLALSLLHTPSARSHATTQPLTLLIAAADQFSDTEGTTIFVKGFDKYLGEDAIREQLTAAFADCGAVSNVRLPSDRESGELKGIGFIEFATTEAKVCAVSAHETRASTHEWVVVHLVKCVVAHLHMVCSASMQGQVAFSSLMGHLGSRCMHWLLQQSAVVSPKHVLVMLSPQCQVAGQLS